MVIIRSNTIRKDGYWFIPSGVYTSVFKAKITKGSNVYNLDDPYLISARITHMSMLEGLSNCELVINNDTGRFNNIIGSEDIEIYLDRTNGTNIRFKGKIDYPIYSLDSQNGYIIRFICRNNPILIDDKIDVISDNSSLLQALIGNTGTSDIYGNKDDGVLYGTGINLYFWNNTTKIWEVNTVSGAAANVILNTSFRDSARSDMIKQLLEKCKCNGYIDYSTNQLRLFNLDDYVNISEYVSYGENLDSIGEYFPDNLALFNKVKVVGTSAESSNIPYMKTKEDFNSQINWWKKADIIYDNSINSMDEVTDKAVKQLATDLLVPTKGSLRVIGGLTTVNPGEKLRVSVPYIIPDGYYRLSSITDSMSANGVFTDIKFGREITTVYHTLTDMTQKNNNLLSYNNPYRVTNNWVTTFDENGSIFTHAGTKIQSSALYLSRTNTTGSCVIGTYTTDSAPTLAEIRANGQDLLNSQIYSRINGGGWNLFSGSISGSLGINVVGNQVDLMVVLTSGTQAGTPGLFTLGFGYK